MRRAPAGEQPRIDHLGRFWETVSAMERKLLALDYDGTLAPFRVGRGDAVPFEGVVPLLEAISGRPDTSLAVVSGRPLKDLRKLLLPWRGELIGSHGFEELSLDGREVARIPDAGQRDGLAQAAGAAREKGCGGLLEVKLSGVALHTRGLSEQEARRVEEELGGIWESISLKSGLGFMVFNRGIELRARGWDKGRALRELLGREPSGTFCVYVGDDLTDEDAFRAVRGKGFGIRVGDPAIPTEATGFLPDVPSVRDFLEAWSRLGPWDGRRR